MPTITVLDQPIAGGTSDEYSLDILTERLTVRELIRSRVYQEVQDYNLKKPDTFRGLVQPTDAEQTLNGAKLRSGREIDWKDQFEKACEAFERNGFFILVDDRQAELLDEEIMLTSATHVRFVKLVPLVGG